MSSSVRLRLAAVVLLVGYFGFLTMANFVPKEARLASGLWPDDLLRLGLDLQGGIHWVLGVDIEAAVKHELEFVAGNLDSELSDDGAPIRRTVVENGQLTLEASNTEALAQLSKAAEDSNILDEVDSEGFAKTYVLTSEWTDEIRERTMSQVLEVLRRRIADPVDGIPDSVVTRQGNDRVLVQIPGGQIDRSRAHNLLKSTGFLAFKIVDDQDSELQGLLGRHPSLAEDREGVYRADGKVVVTETDLQTQRVVAYYLVPEKADITGDYLEDARMNFDQQQRPIVSFRFNVEGGRLFGDLTGANVQRQLAIILDDNVYSAPTVQSRINMNGQITGRFTSQEAADLATVLRAGALSVPVIIEEERTVGPALGHDSIDSGSIASIVGLVLIVAFSIGYYRLSGVYASVALIVNLLLLIGLMSIFEATLTLPGIAGLVLTVGMAVDANVIIFERIREELAVGKTPRAAIATGFNKALGAVLDANITTLITALVLFEFGTGPIKGFAVTLSIGIVTSVFAALVVTRLLFQIYPGNRTIQQLSI